ncbi:MAG: SGNH/GDSL hydrolase family protein [Pseudoflavonifractor sp.]|nr:SGNH/GDSL hydrolase family protein [Pseudoflavonifractor sp.]
MIFTAFGDSNTRYWLGPLSGPGPLSLAWPAQLEQLLRRAGKDISFRNEGRPGGDTSFACREFLRLTADSGGTVLAFGTNDIKLPDATLTEYLGHIESILQKNGGRPLLVLSILWFDYGYGFSGSQSRLPEWNGALASLCRRYDVPFRDTTPRFQERTEWYHDSPSHHLNAIGQEILAEEVLTGLREFHLV